MDELVDIASARVLFRADASIDIGTGHVMRCLTLADALREQGVECAFICREHPGHLLEEIACRGHAPLALPPANGPLSQDGPDHAHWLGTDWQTDAVQTLGLARGLRPDWIVVDHYALDIHWQRAVRARAGRILVIDDLADRAHDCDLLLDPSLGRVAADYEQLVPVDATMLLGPRFALLRPEFARLRADSLARRAAPKLRHLLITMGGVDKGNATGSVLEALNACELPADMRITVVIGPHSPWQAEVQTQAGQMSIPTEVRVDVKDMARLMANCDLAIGAAGSTSWERCCLGLPTIQLVLADNQLECATGFVKLGAVAGVSALTKLRAELPDLISAMHSDRLRDMSARAARICDGSGTPVTTQFLLSDEDARSDL